MKNLRTVGLDPKDFALKSELLISPDASESEVLGLMSEWETQMIKNLLLIREMRNAVSRPRASPGKHQADKKRGRMCKILQAILLVERSDGCFDPGLALESIRKHIPKEARMSMPRFKKLGLAGNHYRAQKSGPFPLYYITREGRQLIAELTPVDPSVQTTHLTSDI